MVGFICPGDKKNFKLLEGFNIITNQYIDDIILLCVLCLSDFKTDCVQCLVYVFNIMDPLYFAIFGLLILTMFIYFRYEAQIYV